MTRSAIKLPASLTTACRGGSAAFARMRPIRLPWQKQLFDTLNCTAEYCEASLQAIFFTATPCDVKEHEPKLGENFVPYTDFLAPQEPVMPLATILKLHERESMYSGANAAIWHSHSLAGHLAKSTAREEDYVATLVTNGIPFLADRWVPLLRLKGVSLRLSGVFCHGHPQVSFGSPPSQVELADLLIVHQHTRAGRASARAILLQAKMSSDSAHRLSASDAQLDLFSRWPPIEFVTGGLAPGTRDLKEHGKGSRYALVHDGRAYPEEITWADQCPWAASVAKQHLTADHSLARLLGDMLLNKDGRPFQLGKPKDDWSRTIQELLQTTGLRTYRRANIGRGPTPRITAEPGLMLMCTDGGQSGIEAQVSRASLLERYFGAVPIAQGDSDDSKTPPSEQRDPPTGGISSLIIETTEGIG